MSCHSPLFRRLVRTLALSLLAGTLVACSPKFDWRTIQSTDNGYAALYPGKPSSASRPVDIGGKRMPMTMDAARVDDTLFAVGMVELGVDDPAVRRAALESMQAGLFANLSSQGAAAPQVRELTVQSAATPPVTLPAVEIRISGVSAQDGTPRRLTARLMAHGARAYQVVVLEAGKTQQDPAFQEQIDQFLDGFHPY